MQSHDLERIAKLVLRELGAGDLPVTVTTGDQPDRWNVDVGGSAPVTLNIRAGAGTTAQFVRMQIFEQYSGR
jgi:hypothetical protein